MWAPVLSSTILRILSLHRQELGRGGLILGIVLGKRSVETRNIYFSTPTWNSNPIVGSSCKSRSLISFLPRALIASTFSFPLVQS